MKKDVENMMQPDRVAEAVTYLAEKKKHIFFLHTEIMFMAG